MNPTDYWNAVAGKKEFTVSVPMALLREHIPLDAAILDFGCGYGRMLRELQEQGCHDLHGVDVADRMLELARKALPRAEFRCNDGVAIPYPDAWFDAVLVVGVLTCIPADADQLALIKEVLRVLKPGGVLCLADFLLNTDERNLRRYEQYKEEYGVHGAFKVDNAGVVRHHAPQWIDNLTRPFATLHREETVFRTMNGHESNGILFFGRAD